MLYKIHCQSPAGVVVPPVACLSSWRTRTCAGRREARLLALTRAACTFWLGKALFHSLPPGTRQASSPFFRTKDKERERRLSLANCRDFPGLPVRQQGLQADFAGSGKSGSFRSTVMTKRYDCGLSLRKILLISHSESNIHFHSPQNVPLRRQA